MRPRVMYIENKSGELACAGRIGLVHFSKSGATLHYADRSFQSLKGSGFKANYFDTATGEEFWISGPRRDGADGLYGRLTTAEDVDPEVALQYWRDIRGLAQPACRGARSGDTPVAAESHAVVVTGSDGSGDRPPRYDGPDRG